MEKEKQKNKTKKRIKILSIIFTILSIIVALLVIVLILWEFGSAEFKTNVIKFLSKQQIARDIIALEVKDNYENSIQDIEFDSQNIVVNETVEKELSGYRNIVLLGIDSRNGSFDANTRSDTILIISINNETGDVKLVSLYRDTFLKIIQDKRTDYYSNVNKAYSIGGAPGAISTLNVNLDLNIDDYIVVNFRGLSEIIDMLGGIDINITKLEMSRINKIGSDMEAETGKQFNELTNYGNVHLDGFQATAYCRIRDAEFYDEQGNEYHYDFGRTARQRYVMEQLIVKAKNSGVSSLIKLAKQIMNMNTEDETFIKTSLEYDEIMDLIPIMIDYKIQSTVGFPFTYATPRINGADLVVAEGLVSNVSVLHEFLFDETEYEPSEEVKQIDEYIADYTEVKAETQ